MSAGLPNCEVCGHRDEIEVNGQFRGGTSVARISRFLRSRWARLTDDQRQKTTLLSAYQLREHMAVCFHEIEAERARNRPKPKYVDPNVPSSIPISVSAAELADPARRMEVLREAMAMKIGELSGDKLFQMYMAELKLQTAQAERDAKSGPATPPVPEGDDLDDAMAQASGHLPDLRVVNGSRGKVSRR